MKLNRIQFDKIRLRWEILKYGTIEVHIQQKINKILDRENVQDIFGNVAFTENDIISERLVNIEKKIPLLLEKENYEELARLKKIYVQLLKRYKDNEQDN